MSETNDAPQKPRSIAFACGFLYAAATDAYRRCEVAAPSLRTTLHSSDPFVAVVFAVAAFEGFINDAIEMVSPLPPIHHGPLCTQFGVIGKHLRERRAGTEEKLDLAHVIFTGKPFDRGVCPYQDWALLRDLRNKLVHMRPDDGYFEHEEDMSMGELVSPKVIDGLETKNILDDSGRQWANWHPLIQTAGVARWACNVSADMVDALVAVGDTRFREVLRLLVIPFSKNRPNP